MQEERHDKALGENTSGGHEKNLFENCNWNSGHKCVEANVDTQARPLSRTPARLLSS